MDLQCSRICNVDFDQDDAERAWSHFAQVGRAVTLDEYERVERAYVSCLSDLCEAAKIDALVVRDLSVPAERTAQWRENDVVSRGELADIVSSLLREEFWCRLEGTLAFIHFGWDLNVYFGSKLAPMVVKDVAEGYGLHARAAKSPYAVDRDRDLVDGGES